MPTEAHDPVHAGQRLAEEKVRRLAEAAGVPIAEIRWQDFGCLVVLEVRSPDRSVDRRFLREWVEDLGKGGTRPVLDVVLRDLVRALRD